MKTIEQFISENRTEISMAIYGRLYGTRPIPEGRKLDDEDLEQWILNDEGLYLWAKDEGVEI